MKRAFVTMPMLLPRLSDKAAAQLLDILALLHDCMRHHYGPQAHRWLRQQCQRDPPRPAGTPSPPLDEPF